MIFILLSFSSSSYNKQQANVTELNHTSDGFLNMLKDEDLQLMDMAMNEGMLAIFFLMKKLTV